MCGIDDGQAVMAELPQSLQPDGKVREYTVLRQTCRQGAKAD